MSAFLLTPPLPLFVLFFSSRFRWLLFFLLVFCRPVLSPQICIRVSSQGLRLLCLLTCSSLSQVNSDPTPRTSPPAPFLLLLSFMNVRCCASGVVGSCSVLFWRLDRVLELVAPLLAVSSTLWSSVPSFIQIWVKVRGETRRGRLYDPTGFQNSSDALWGGPARIDGLSHGCHLKGPQMDFLLNTTAKELLLHKHLHRTVKTANVYKQTFITVDWGGRGINRAVSMCVCVCEWGTVLFCLPLWCMVSGHLVLLFILM